VDKNTGYCRKSQIKNRKSKQKNNIMGLFSFFTQELAIDLGTANTVVIYNDRIVVDEPSIVAIDQSTGKLIAVGELARQMHGKTPEKIKTVRPLRDGVIADFHAAEQMIRGMIKKIPSGTRLFRPSLRIVVAIPSGSTEVEVRAVRDSSEHAGGQDVYLIYEPMAAALGVGLDVEAPEGNMVVDIGGGTAEIAVIALGGIVCNKSIRTAGDVFTTDIQTYMRHQHNIKIGERTAEDIKIHVGSALSELETPPADYVVRGPNLMTALPIEVSVSYQDVAYSLDRSISKIESGILNVLEQTPPELYADVVGKGVFLTGGGALLRGLDKRLTDKINIPFHVVEDPLHAVARGTGIALKNIGNFQFLMR
jgi:rod shape-determining protein MreB